MTKKRQKRSNSLPTTIQPVSAVVELVWLIDYSVMSMFNNLVAEDITALRDDSHVVNLMLYFAHLTTMVSKLHIYIQLLTNQFLIIIEPLYKDNVAKNKLNAKNADDIYNSLKQLKGSALKVAQMLSMEKNILPQAYVEKFSLAQFSVPPLSPPLVIKTFKKYH